MRNPRIKVCCISSTEEAKPAIALGASAVGLVSAMPSGPGVIDEDLIVEIARSVPPPIGTFLLTSHQTVEQIVAQHCHCRTNIIQVCDHLVDGEYDDLRAALPGISLVQVIHVEGSESIVEAVEVAPRWMLSCSIREIKDLQSRSSVKRVRSTTGRSAEEFAKRSTSPSSLSVDSLARQIGLLA